MPLPYDTDAALRTLKQADPVLGGWIDRIGPFTMEMRDLQNPFEALLRAIVYQQLSGKAAATIHGRLLARFDEVGGLDPEALLAMPDENLRGAGLSRAKTAAAQDLAAKTLDGTVPNRATLETLDDDAILKRLTQVRGIGPWTVQMLLMFNLGRPDVLPTTDLGVQRGFQLAHGLDELPKPRELAAYGERWRPYRSVASWYLWRVVDARRA